MLILLEIYFHYTYVKPLTNSSSNWLCENIRICSTARHLGINIFEKKQTFGAPLWPILSTSFFYAKDTTADVLSLVYLHWYSPRTNSFVLYTIFWLHLAYILIYVNIMVDQQFLVLPCKRLSAKGKEQHFTIIRIITG